jgi:hypothetical protein
MLTPISEQGVIKPPSCLIEVNQVEKMTATIVHIAASPKATNCHRFDMRSLYQSDPLLEVHLRTV